MKEESKSYKFGQKMGAMFFGTVVLCATALVVALTVRCIMQMF